MKSYNHLWEKFVSEENIILAINNASKGKRTRASVKRRLENPNLVEEIKHYAENFKNHHHRPKQIYDGIQRKVRTIIVPTFDENVIHHMIVNVLKPIFSHGMYEHSYGSIPGRGPFLGKKQIKKWITHGGKNCKYCLKMDIKKYFDSVPHDIFLRNLRKIIHDQRFMEVLEEITEVIPEGLPLGFYTSQWTANWYLQGLDHYIKEDLEAKYYIRYMDDMIVFDGNKRKLHQIREAVSKYLYDNLGLELKSTWQVFRFDYNGKYRFLDFMGFRFYRDRITLRRSILKKMYRKTMKLFHGKRSIYSSRQMLSYLGWIKHTDVYGFYSRHIKPFIDFQRLKQYVSTYDRKRGMNNGMVQVTELRGTA